MKKIITLLMCIGIGTAHASSMCLVDLHSTGSNSGAVDGVDGNRGTWTNGSRVAGESHCSKLGVITPDNANQFEEFGIYCWCRITHVAAPNGFLARRDGAWALGLSAVGAWNTQSCATQCASSCASVYRSSVGFRRALLVSQNVEF